jgi:hypothetical protein
LVPVVDKNNKPIMPCSEKRARKLLEKGDAVSRWKNQIFYIQLVKSSGNLLQDVTIGIDPGSKREGFTVATDTKVVLNILSEARQGIKEVLETRRTLRRSRRNRKTPYRKCRFNRSAGRLSPSTKARWDQKLRIITLLKKILPISTIIIEEISAKTKKGAKRWNKSFSPLQVGKEYFREEVKKFECIYLEQEGFNTKIHRDIRGFKKTNQKLNDVWSAHCVDSHSLCEIATGTEIQPFLGMYKFENFKWSRRQLHVQISIKGGIRKEYGRTVSLGIPRGTLTLHPKYGIVYIGGTSKGKLSLHSLDGKRLTQSAKKEDCNNLCVLKWRTVFLPDLKVKVSNRKN